MGNPDSGSGNKANLLLTGICLVLFAGATSTAFAEIKIIEADSTYVLGDNDSKIDARRITVQEAKRKALELAGTYVESLTLARNYQLTKEEIKAYTAGIIESEIIADEMRGTAQHPEIYIKIRCRIDTDTLAASIDRFRENEDLKEQLIASTRENEELKRERDSLVSRLSAEKNAFKAEKTRKQLDDVLNREETNQDTEKLLVRLSSGPDDEEAVQALTPEELNKAVSALERVKTVNPRNQRARYLLAAVYQKMGKYEIAEKELRDAIRRNPSNPAPHMKLALLLRQRGKNEEALKEFHFVERLRPRNPLILFYMGVTYRDLGRCGKAIQYLQRFVQNSGPASLEKKRETARRVIAECGGGLRGAHRRSVTGKPRMR